MLYMSLSNIEDFVTILLVKLLGDRRAETFKVAKRDQWLMKKDIGELGLQNYICRKG